MKYKEAITQSMEMLARDPRVVFLGYNISFGSQAYGTLKTISKERKIEMPVAENLMIGLAGGLALEGYRPVVFFERHDFLLNGLDALVNHVDKIDSMSHGQYKMPVIIRAVVGSKKLLNAGPQHTQDFSMILKRLLKMRVYEPKNTFEIMDAYREIIGLNETTDGNEYDEPSLIIEHKDLYDKE